MGSSLSGGVLPASRHTRIENPARAATTIDSLAARTACFDQRPCSQTTKKLSTAPIAALRAIWPSEKTPGPSGIVLRASPGQHQAGLRLGRVLGAAVDVLAVEGQQAIPVWCVHLVHPAPGGSRDGVVHVRVGYDQQLRVAGIAAAPRRGVVRLPKPGPAALVAEIGAGVNPQCP